MFGQFATDPAGCLGPSLPVLAAAVNVSTCILAMAVACGVPPQQQQQQQQQPVIKSREGKPREGLEHGGTPTITNGIKQFSDRVSPFVFREKQKTLVKLDKLYSAHVLYYSLLVAD